MGVSVVRMKDGTDVVLRRAQRTQHRHAYNKSKIFRKR